MPYIHIYIFIYKYTLISRLHLESVHKQADAWASYRPGSNPVTTQQAFNRINDCTLDHQPSLHVLFSN